MKRFSWLFGIVLAALLAGCGTKVDVPPAMLGKIMTKDGYREGTIAPSSFRLDWCWAYCDNLVLVDTSDRAAQERLQIFIPEDKLNLELEVQVTMSLNAAKSEALFGSISPTESAGSVSLIDWDTVYKTYAKQIVMTETREYLSKYSISQIASSLEKVNGELRDILSKKIQDRTPFVVRYAGITKIEYPKIITAAQENAAQRREQIQQEEAQLEISKVQLSRELQETQLRRQIDLEKAKIEAQAQLIQREVVDEKVLKLRQLENERAWINKWSGVLPQTVMSSSADTKMLLNIPAPAAISKK